MSSSTYETKNIVSKTEFSLAGSLCTLTYLEELETERLVDQDVAFFSSRIPLQGHEFALLIASFALEPVYVKIVSSISMSLTNNNNKLL